MRNALRDRSERSIPQRGLDLAAGELPDEVDRAGAGFANDVNERSVGVELYLARLRLVGGHRHDGGGRGGGLSALFAYFDLRFLEHLGNEHIPVRKPAEVGAWLEHCRRAKAGLFKAC